MIDEKGISISYEVENITSRQNFTKCHEIGHLILEHNGTFFAEIANSKDQQEVEADYFSSIILMPDIILLTKVIYQKLSFQQMQEQLQVSSAALKVRLTQFIQYYTNIPYPNVQSFVSSYKANTPAKERLFKCIKSFENQIVSNFKYIESNQQVKIQNLITKKSFLHHFECPEIIDKEFLKQLSEIEPHIKYGTYFDFGKALQYIYDSNTLSAQEANAIAKNFFFKLLF